MTSTTATAPASTRTDATWLRGIQVSIAVSVVALLVFAYVGTFFTTISDGGAFKYAADYWYTATGLPIALAGIAITVGLHKLQHGADGRLGTIGVWVNAIALIALFAQLLAAILTSSEVRWGPSYPLCTLLTFIGVALLSAGSWRTGLLPRWMLGVFPFVWIIGGFAAQGPTPLLLLAFLVMLGVTLTRRVTARAA